VLVFSFTPYAASPVVSTYRQVGYRDGYLFGGGKCCIVICNITHSNPKCVGTEGSTRSGYNSIGYNMVIEVEVRIPRRDNQGL